MKLPTFHPYCEDTTAVNALLFDLGPIRVWYSYRTPVAFQDGNGPIIVRQNDWGPTTGKHLNAIDGGNKADRISGGEFELSLQMVLEAIEAPQS